MKEEVEEEEGVRRRHLISFLLVMILGPEEIAMPSPLSLLSLSLFSLSHFGSHSASVSTGVKEHQDSPVHPAEREASPENPSLHEHE